MLEKKIRILNFDHSLVKQKALLSQYENEVIDLTDLGEKARHWMNAQTRARIEKRIPSPARNCVNFLGSGDFHHISEILISRFTEPLNLVSFDAHPDWTILPPRFGCGSWVSEVLKKKNILKAILLGVSSDDISSFLQIQTGNFAALKDDRLEIYPYAHQPSLTFLKRVPQNLSLKVRPGILLNKIYWTELKDKNLEEFLPAIFQRLPAKKVYVSIDKDCLKSAYALTNWEEGRLTLEELLLMLKLIKENLDIVGLDIVGDYSEISLEGMLKRIISRLDHPKDILARTFPEPVVIALNQETNLKILSAVL